MSEAIETTAEDITEKPQALTEEKPQLSLVRRGENLAQATFKACAKGPTIVPELLVASEEELRAALKQSMLPEWIARDPQLTQRVNTLDSVEARNLLILFASFWQRGYQFAKREQLKNGE